jgi:12-hydroxyjasmonoyl-L-amino acid 12-hydroxylase / fatty acid hydroxylase
VMGKMKDIWGDDVNEFKPARWIETHENGAQKFKDEDPYRFPQFNAGLRICLGKYMAIMETEIVICQLLRRFKFSLAMNENDLEYIDTLTLSLKNGLFMNIKAI